MKYKEKKIDNRVIAMALAVLFFIVLAISYVAVKAMRQSGEIIAVKEQFHSLEDEIDNLGTNLAAEFALNKDLTTSNGMLMDSVNLLNEQVKYFRGLIREASKELESMTLSELKEEITKYALKAERLKKQLERLKASTKGIVKSEKGVLYARVDSLRRVIVEKDSIIDHRDLQIANFDLRLNIALGNVDSLETKIEELTEDGETDQVTIDSMEEQLQKGYRKIAKLYNSIDSTANVAQENETALQKSQKEVARLMNEIDVLAKTEMAVFYYFRENKLKKVKPILLDRSGNVKANTVKNIELKFRIVDSYLRECQRTTLYIRLTNSDNENVVKEMTINAKSIEVKTRLADLKLGKGNYTIQVTCHETPIFPNYEFTLR